MRSQDSSKSCCPSCGFTQPEGSRLYCWTCGYPMWWSGGRGWASVEGSGSVDSEPSTSGAAASAIATAPDTRKVGS